MPTWAGWKIGVGLDRVMPPPGPTALACMVTLPLMNFCIGMRGMAPVPTSRKPHWMVPATKVVAEVRVI